MKIVVKYPNRKLYDPERSGYVSIAELVKQPLGSFKILKHRGEEDITNEILLSALSLDSVEIETKVKIMEYCIDMMSPNEDLFN